MVDVFSLLQHVVLVSVVNCSRLYYSLFVILYQSRPIRFETTKSGAPVEFQKVKSDSFLDLSFVLVSASVQ